MNYYYDILVNFQDDDLYEFYEWEETDNIERLKKIPLFRVNSITFNDFIKYKLEIDLSFLESIKDKTVLHSGKLTECLEYAFLISDAKNSLAVEVNQNGEVISLSKLQLVDDLNINEIIYNLREKKITYKKQAVRKVRNRLRQEELVKKVILLELKTLYQNKALSKMKYIYSEWFESSEDNIEKMYQKMTTEINKQVTDIHYKIYEIIKLSYQKNSSK